MLPLSLLGSSSQDTRAVVSTTYRVSNSGLNCLLAHYLPRRRMLDAQGSLEDLIFCYALFLELTENLLSTELPLKHLASKSAPVNLTVLVHLALETDGHAD